MGQLTDARIRDWQERAGIAPARGRRAQTLERLSQLAFELIKVIELERAGIRDGDGHWYGTDPVGGILHDLVAAERDDLHATVSGSDVPVTEAADV